MRRLFLFIALACAAITGGAQSTVTRSDRAYFRELYVNNVPVTSSGALDTSKVSTRAWRQKGIDSVMSVLAQGLSGLLNYTDDEVNAAVNNYIVKPDTNIAATRRWRQKGIDSVMSVLGGYLKRSDSTAYATREWRQKGIDSVMSVLGGYLKRSDSTVYATREWRQKGIDSVMSVLTVGAIGISNKQMTGSQVFSTTRLAAPVSSSPTFAGNGDMVINSTTNRLQFRVNNTNYSALTAENNLSGLTNTTVARQNLDIIEYPVTSLDTVNFTWGATAAPTGWQGGFWRGIRIGNWVSIEGMGVYANAGTSVGSVSINLPSALPGFAYTTVLPAVSNRMNGISAGRFATSATSTSFIPAGAVPRRNFPNTADIIWIQSSSAGLFNSFWFSLTYTAQ